VAGQVAALKGVSIQEVSSDPVSYTASGFDGQPGECEARVRGGAGAEGEGEGKEEGAEVVRAKLETVI